MPRANAGDDWGLEPGTLPELPGPYETREQKRGRQLVEELKRWDATLTHSGLADFDLAVVADALSRKAAALHVLAALEPELRRQAAAARDAQERREVREREEREEGERLAQQLEGLRAAMVADDGLRREVESRNFRDRLSPGSIFGPLPGGFDDSLRRKL